MKNTFLKIIGGTLLAILMVTMFTQIFVSARENSNEESPTQIPENASGEKGDMIEGVWNLQVTRINCQTGVAIGSGPAMLTFARGGTVHDFGTGRPPSIRSPGYGVWSFISDGQYTDAFQFYIYHSDGTFGGRQIIREQIQLSHDGNSLTNSAISQILDVNGNVTSTRCSTAIGTRFQ